MSEIRHKPLIPEDYPYHLPDKPLPPTLNGKISYEDFLDWADEDTLAEWVDGEIEMSSPASLPHERIFRLLNGVIGTYVLLFDLGEVIAPPFQMKLPGKRGSGREPDLIFLSKEHLDRLRNTFVEGPADLVVEIVSPESRKRDRQTKFREYAEGGVPEFWLIDPENNQVNFYQLEGTTYRQVLPDEEGKYFSPGLAGFWLKTDWLWQKPLPDESDILLEVAGEAYLRFILEKSRKHGLNPPLA